MKIRALHYTVHPNFSVRQMAMFYPVLWQVERYLKQFMAEQGRTIRVDIFCSVSPDRDNWGYSQTYPGAGLAEVEVAVARLAYPVIGPKLIETVLLHEMGHVLGLVPNSKLVEPGDDLGHCPDPTCVMTKPKYGYSSIWHWLWQKPHFCGLCCEILRGMK